MANLKITNSLSFIKHLKPNLAIKLAILTKQSLLFPSIGAESQNILEIKRGDAILRVRQVSYFENGLPFEYVRTQYAGSRFEFYLEK